MRAIKIDEVDQLVKIGLGVYQESCSNRPGHSRIMGEVQDKWDITSFWAMINSVLLFVHTFLVYKRLELPGVDEGPGFK